MTVSVTRLGLGGGIARPLHGYVGIDTGEENFAAYAETDPNHHFEVINNTRIWFRDLDQDEDAYLAYDHGAAFFSGDYEHRFTFEIKSGSNSGIAVLWMLSDVLDDRQGIAESHSIEFRYNAGTPQMVLIEKDGGTAYSDTGTSSYSLNTQYWVKVVRDETAGTLAATVYTDEFVTVHDSSMSITLTDNTEDWRYSYGLNTVNSATANQNIHGWVGDLKFVTTGDVTLNPAPTARIRTVYNPLLDLSAGGGSNIDLLPLPTSRVRTTYNPTITKTWDLAPTVLSRTRTIYNPTLSLGDTIWTIQTPDSTTWSVQTKDATAWTEL